MWQFHVGLLLTTVEPAEVFVLLNAVSAPPERASVKLIDQTYDEECAALKVCCAEKLPETFPV